MWQKKIWNVQTNQNNSKNVLFVLVVVVLVGIGDLCFFLGCWWFGFWFECIFPWLVLWPLPVLLWNCGFSCCFLGFWHWERQSISWGVLPKSLVSVRFCSSVKWLLVVLFCGWFVFCAVLNLMVWFPDHNDWKCSIFVVLVLSSVLMLVELVHWWKNVLFLSKNTYMRILLVLEWMTEYLLESDRVYQFHFYYC